MIPETEAASRIASVLGEHLDPRWLTDQAMQAISSKVVAHRGFIRSVFDSLDANPRRLPERDVLLRQDATAQLDSAEWWGEHLHHLERECADARAIYERVKAGTLAEFDPDERDADRADAKAREVAQDEAANREAVRP